MKRKKPSLSTVRALRRRTIELNRLLKAGQAIAYEQGQKIKGDRITILAQTSAIKKLSDRNDLNLATSRAAIRDLLRFYDDGVKTTADHARLLEIRSWIK